ncbi:hypothetical protein HID58_074223, partial [Brassica napus]
RIQNLVAGRVLTRISTSESEEEGKIRGRNDKLTVEGDLREMGKNAAWSVSSCKPGNGVNTLRDDDLETFWQSDGLQPHLINIQFQKKVRLQDLGWWFCTWTLSWTRAIHPVRSIRAGDGFHNLKEMKSVELVKPSGWVCVSMSGSDPPYVLHFQNYGFLLVVSLVNNLASCSDKMNRVFATSSSRDTFVNTFMLQISILSNHLNGPRPCVCLFDCRNRIPRQPFQFTSTEFLTYSTLR